MRYYAAQRASMQRTPLNLLDQQFLPWDRVEPLCILCELRVRGRLRDVRVVDAVRTAISHHAMARARLAPPRWRQTRQYWEIVDDVHDVPFQIVECADDHALDNARSHLLSRRIDLHAAPPFALMLAHRSGGDSLCMSLSHVAADGVSAQRLMRSIVCAYAGIEESTVGPDPLAVRDLSFYGRQPSSRERIRSLRRMLKLRRSRESEDPPTRLLMRRSEPNVGDSGSRGFHLLHLDRDETAVAIARRTARATVNDLLISSLALAVRKWNDRRGLEPNRIHVQMPVNLRPRQWADEVVSNIGADVNVVVPARAQRSLVTAQLAVAEQTRAAKARRASSEIDVATILNFIPVPLRYTTASLLQKRASHNTTISLSNLGRVAFPDLGDDAGSVTEFWFAPSAGAALGALAGAVTLNAELFLALHYRTLELDTTGAQAFAELWREVLVG